MPRQLFRTLILTASILRAASSMRLHKREQGLKCSTCSSCQSYYTTENTNCTAGYEAIVLETNGDPYGTYCEKSCSQAQTAACAASKCTLYTDECAKYKGNAICSNALSWCEAPISMPQDSCTHVSMGFPVTFDQDTGKCSLDKDPEHSARYLRFRFGAAPDDEGDDGEDLFLSCAPITLDGAHAVADAITAELGTDVFRRCDELPDEELYELLWVCRQDASRFDAIEGAAWNACVVADYPGRNKPAFASSRGTN